MSVANIRINKLSSSVKHAEREELNLSVLTINTPRDGWCQKNCDLNKRLQAPQLESDYGECGTHERVHSQTPSHGKSAIEIGQQRKNPSGLHPTPLTQKRPSSLSIGYGKCGFMNECSPEHLRMGRVRIGYRIGYRRYGITKNKTHEHSHMGRVRLHMETIGEK